MKTKTVRNLLIVLVLFPLMYIGYSMLPWAKELFVNNNVDFYIPFWTGVIVLHWLTFYAVCKMLKQEGKSLKDIGYNLKTKGTVILVLSYVVGAFLVFGFTEMSLKFVTIDAAKLDGLSNLFPKTTSQRLLFILTVFTAGFCEEIIYRGFAITKLSGLGLNKWIAILPAGIAFVFIHGIIGFSQFWFYFIAAIIFGVLFVLTKRLLPNIILHLLFDLTAMMAIFQAISQ